MIDPRSSRHIDGWLAEPDGPSLQAYYCDEEARNWLVQWVATVPPGSVWADLDGELFQVWPVCQPIDPDDDSVPIGTVCPACCREWNGARWA
jgi:hypothetical protein